MNAGIGVSARAVRRVRDAWILVAARCPEHVPGWAKEQHEILADPDFRRLYLATGQVYDGDPSDPRLEELADAMVALAGRQAPELGLWRSS
jgi:hypothetical protein